MYLSLPEWALQWEKNQAMGAWPASTLAKAWRVHWISTSYVPDKYLVSLALVLSCKPPSPRVLAEWHRSVEHGVYLLPVDRGMSFWKRPSWTKTLSFLANFLCLPMWQSWPSFACAAAQTGERSIGLGCCPRRHPQSVRGWGISRRRIASPRRRLISSRQTLTMTRTLSTSGTRGSSRTARMATLTLSASWRSTASASPREMPASSATTSFARSTWTRMDTSTSQSFFSPSMSPRRGVLRRN